MRIEDANKGGRIVLIGYAGHLPVAVGHLEFEGGKCWLGVAVTAGHERKGYGSAMVKALCARADSIGQCLWLTCRPALVWWYEQHGFVSQRQLENGQVEMHRPYKRLDASH